MYVQVGCETFCLDDDVAIQEATAALKTEACATAEKIKLFPSAKSDDIALGECCTVYNYSVSLLYKCTIKLHIVLS